MHHPKKVLIGILSSGLISSGQCFGRGTTSFLRSKTSCAFFASIADDATKRRSSTSLHDSLTASDVHAVIDSLPRLESGSDIRGQFVDHETKPGLMIRSAVDAISDCAVGSPAPLTPLAAYCFGYSFAEMVASLLTTSSINRGGRVIICVGRDPRSHGAKLADQICRGAAAFGATVKNTGLATTPSMFEFCRSKMCDGAVMVTASHLPGDRNGLKFFSNLGGFTKHDIHTLIAGATVVAERLCKEGLSSDLEGGNIESVDFMPHYAATLRNAIKTEVEPNLSESTPSSVQLPLAGLRIVLNAGNGSGAFFVDVLRDLGADVSASLGVEPDGRFPSGVPNPESNQMVEATMKACEESNADIGVMLDTDADRCGFIVPRIVRPGSSSQYEPLNRNRLIALLSVIFSSTSPGCAIVTDSVTSEGLATFIEHDLGLRHVRFLRGYANVIGKAKELTESGAANAEVAIETSGHCAMRENGYLDDGTYTAVKIIALLARVAGSSHTSLLELISGLEEMEEVQEIRLAIKDGSVETTAAVFDDIAAMVESGCKTMTFPGWEFDEDNLEGVRVRTGDGGFFMLRKSLHDPLVSLQIESSSKDKAKASIVGPLIGLMCQSKNVEQNLDMTILENY